jgi:hypothetical protein
MYEIGQQVVCVKTHSQGIVKEGQVHSIKRIALCSCGYISLDVGITFNDGNLMVCTCGKKESINGTWWLGAKLFRPLDDLYNTKIEELMNEVNEKKPFEV